MSEKHLSYGVITLITFLGLGAIIYMVGATFFDANGLTFSGYIRLMEDGMFWKHTINSLVLAISVAFSATLSGLFLALLLTKTHLYMRYLFIIALLIPLLIPPYILAYGWYALLGREGLLGGLLFGFWGSAFVLFSVYLPIPLFISALFLRYVDPKLEEAGLLVCNGWCVLRGITIPLLAPSLGLSFLLVFILSISELSVAQFLHYDTFVLESFIQFSAFYDFKTATVYAMPLVIMVFAVLWGMQKVLTKTLYSVSYHKKMLMMPLGILKIPLFLVILLLVALIVGLPLGGLILQSSLSSFSHALSESFPVIKATLFYGTLGATVLTIFGFLSAYIIVYCTSYLGSLFEKAILLMFMLSSTVIGIGLILFWNHQETNFIYTTAMIILIGYLVKYLLLTTEISVLNLRQIPASFIESAQLSGASWYERLWYIIFPLAKESLLLAWGVGFIFVLRESTITMLVAPPGESTLSVYILTQMANGAPAHIASLCLLMLILVLLPLTLLMYSMKKRSTL